MFYIGKHYGSECDGYICSSQWMLRDYKQNPEHFKRRILEYVDDIDGSQMLKAELKWLALIPNEELGKKYYNLKNKNFGNTRGHKKSHTWNTGMSKDEQQEYIQLRKNKLFCLLSEKPKKGVLFRPIIQYSCKFCGKSFESKIVRKFCSRICSSKWSVENGLAEKLSKALKGKTAWNKGLPNSISAQNAKKGAVKQSQTVTGRKMLVREDGSRTWIYPDRENESR